MTAELPAPVITIDGPSGTGKGTIARALAKHFGWHLLDSGALYRIVAYAAQNKGISLDDEATLVQLAAHLPISFSGLETEETNILLEGKDVTKEIRSEKAGNSASKVAALPKLREALLQRQRDFCQPPGLVADGRDMGTVIFPSAEVKIYLLASAEERAKRRYKQLKEKGIDAKLHSLSRDIAERDVRDQTRTVAPLVAAPDAHTIDTTGLDIQTVFNRVLHIVHEASLPWINGR